MRRSSSTGSRGGARRPTEVWEGDRRPTTAVVTNEPGQAPFSPDLVLWADITHGTMVGTDVVAPDAPPEAAAESLQRAMESPAPGSGQPRRPDVVRVRTREFAEAVRPVADPLGIQVEVVGALPLIDQMFQFLDTQFGAQAPDAGYLEGSGLPEPVVADLFAAAAGLFPFAPWETLHDSDTILLECPDWLRRRYYAIVMGAGREVFGFALYERLEDVETIRDLDPLEPDAAQIALSVPALSLQFEHVGSLGERQAAEPAERGWTMASHDAYPLVICTGPGRESHWPSEAEARVLIAASRALGPFVARLGELPSLPAARQPLVQEQPVTVVGEPVAVTATFPAVAFD